MNDRSRFVARRVLAAALFTALGRTAAAQPARPANPGAARRTPTLATEFPKQILFGETSVLVDAPLVESLEGDRLKARGTVRFQRAGDMEPAVANVWYDAVVAVDHSRRLVTLTSVQVPRLQLPGAALVKQQRLAARLGQAFTRHPLTLSLDDVLAGAKLAARGDEAPPKLGTEPPRILFETRPAVLVLFDGAPRFRAVEGSFLERAVNTPFLVLHDGVAHAYYLDGGTAWFRAPDAAGPWEKADVPPPEAIRIANRDLEDAGIAPGEVTKAAASGDRRAPKIIVATEPTELVVSDGPPVWSTEVEGELEAMHNTDSDVFRTTADGRIWLALSGRWYRSDTVAGPWTYVSPDELPASFGRIRADSDKAEVLAFVPGTAPAREALRDAATPRTAAVRRSEAHVDVAYDGEPKFEAVPGTRVEYALNTPESVLRIGGRYYVCDQGVWFTGDAPTGPWSVADSIPDREIQELPPESPVYNTRFATVYDSTPDTVYVAYTPAYLGSYPYYGTVVFGTGYFYRPWWGASYYPRPWTWGFHARWAASGGWGWGFGWGPAWAGFRYGFGFGWGARWCGPGGFYRPVYRNVNVTRNVTVNRNVNVSRSLYASGANVSRTATASAAARSAATGARSGKTANGAKSTGHATSARAGKAHAAKPHGGGKHEKEK